MSRSRFVGLAGWALAGAAAAQGISESDSYRYQLELNADAKLCRQMERVYNAEFKRPWDRRAKRAAFGRVPGTKKDDALEAQLVYSAA